MGIGVAGSVFVNRYGVPVQQAGVWWDRFKADDYVADDPNAEERRRAERFPPDENAARFLGGMDRLRRRDFAGAAREFEALLEAAPEHFTARLFQALCALHQGRPAEARVGLTACVAQRPRFAWSYQFRGECAQKLGDLDAATRDFERAAALQPGDAGR